jgi:hypothetical protein
MDEDWLVTAMQATRDAATMVPWVNEVSFF